MSMSWQIFKTIPEEKPPFWSDVVLGFRSMTEQEMKKFPQHKCGQAFTTLKCDCPPYLLWLEKRYECLDRHIAITNERTILLDKTKSLLSEHPASTSSQTDASACSQAECDGPLSGQG